MTVEPLRLSETLHFAAEAGFKRAVSTAARQQRQNTSEFLRQTIRAALRERGVSMDAVATTPSTTVVSADQRGEP